MMRLSLPLVLATLPLCLMLLPSAGQANPLFDIQNWNTVSLRVGYYYDGNPGWTSGDVMATGGLTGSDDPSGSYLLNTTHVAAWSPNSINGMTSTVTSFIVNETTSYNPSLSGAIASVDFSIASTTVNFATGWGDQIVGGFQASIFMLVQNKTTYVLKDYFFNTPGNWVTFSATGMLATDFIAWGPNAWQYNVDSHPDFSSSGASILFGFTGSNSTGNFGSNYGTSVKFDNFAVTINRSSVAPEPGSFGLFLPVGLSMIGCLRPRNRRTARKR